MQREQLNLTEEDGYNALREHVRLRALAARDKHGPELGEAEVRRMLADPEVMRFPTKLAFDRADLMLGEFGWARAVGERPADGFTLLIHPLFEGRWELLPLLIAYHIVAVNYLDVVTNEEAELFGSTLCGMDREEYYTRLCEVTDSIPGATYDPKLEQRFESAVASLASAGSSGGCGGGCSCKGA